MLIRASPIKLRIPEDEYNRLRALATATTRGRLKKLLYTLAAGEEGRILRAGGDTARRYRTALKDRTAGR